MSKPARISVQVSPETKDKLNSFLQRRGLKQNFVVEQALLYYLEAKRAKLELTTADGEIGPLEP